MKFSLGTTVVTQGIANEIEGSPVFEREVKQSLNRYVQGDWGELCEEDKELNNNALDPKNPDRILASYETSKGKIWIITEWDRSVTTILFPSEY